MSDNYYGYRYLMDANTTRQYAARFDDGKIVKVDVYSEDAREAGLPPNGTFFAFDDDIQREDMQNGRVRLSMQAWQFTSDATGRINGASYRPVSFDVVFRPETNGDFKLIYQMTADSIKLLKDSGFSDAMPKTYTTDIPANDPGVAGGKLSRALTSNLAFPPHQDGTASVARFNVELQPRTQDTVAPQPKTPSRTGTGTTSVPVRKKPANDFNNGSGTAVQPRPSYKIADSTIEAVIKQYCKDLSEQAALGRLDPVVGRDTETDQALKVLSRRKQASLCFTGDAGVGKTAMFTGIAQRIADGDNVPEALEGARVLQLDLQAMNAGAKFRGQFEEKLKPLIDGLQERQGYLKGRKIIIAIDEIHSQLTAGKAEGGSDAGNMMKPFLTSQGISVMGTTTGEEYRKHIEKDPALSSRFEQMVLGEPDRASTKVILERLWPAIKAHHKLAEDLADEDFDYIIDMSTRYAPNESQPRKGEKVLDMAGASAQFRRSPVIEKEDIISAVAQMSKLDVSFLNQGDHERFIKMEEELPKKVLGQPGIQRVVDGLIGSRAGLTDPDQPWGCFVLQGPTGTGKTELCKALAQYLFGTDEAMIKLDMAEYSDKHTVSRLIGAPPGFVGFDSAEPALTERVRQRPYSIVLFDEIEKAHPDVFNVLLSILNDGKMTDNHGKTVLFNNVIVIMTTNLGAKEAMDLIEGRGGMSFGASEDLTPAQLEEKLTKRYAEARKGFFRPEMINRIEELGGFVTFVPLSQKVVADLAVREIEKVGKRLPIVVGNKNITLEVSDEVKTQISEQGYNRAMGARPMRKVVREKIQNPLGKWLMANKGEVLKMIKDTGGAKLVIDKIGETFAPVIQPAQAPAIAAANDDKAARKRKLAPDT